VGKIEEALEQIGAIDSLVERSLFLGALASSLFKLKQLVPVLIGRTAFECYTDAADGAGRLHLGFSGNLPSPRILQEIFAGQLQGVGALDEWEILGVHVLVQGGYATELPELCRDFETDFGVAKLAPAEELTAQRVLAAVYPVANGEARFEAKVLIAGGITESFVMDWPVLQKLCDSQAYRVGEALAQLRMETKRELDEAAAAQSAEVPVESESATGPVA
jgi:hypothetical protein